MEFFEINTKPTDRQLRQFGLICVAAPLVVWFWSRSVLTIPIGLVVGEILMALIYFGLFLPMAIVFRITGRDALQRRVPETVSSFRQKRVQPSGVRRYYRRS